MRYLVDTSVWIWAVGPQDRLNARAQRLLSDGRTELFFSAASAWEISIKAALGKLVLPDHPARYVPQRLAEQGIAMLPITVTHALSVFDLPVYHQDPFDRLLIAQALREDLVVLTADAVFSQYSVRTFWCGR